MPIGKPTLVIKVVIVSIFNSPFYVSRETLSLSVINYTIIIDKKQYFWYNLIEKIGDKIMSDFYDGTKLLSLLDIDGKKPEIYMCTANRNGGKTTYFSRLCVNRYLKFNEKFCIVYRYNYELDDCADNFFKDIGGLFFKDHDMRNERRASGTYHELFLDDKSCGYAVSLNNADSLKKKGHMLSDTCRMFFDEFQSETNHYCPDEVKKFISIHTTIARGQGQMIRYVPVYMISNPVSIINPYYIEMGISNRLRTDTNFLRGQGFVLEQGFVEAASKAQASSGFNKAFSGNDYVAYSAQGVYLNDNSAFLDKPYGTCRYLATLKFKGAEYAIREYPEQGIIYVNDKVDNSFKYKLTVTTDDHNINYVMLKRNDLFIKNMRFFFERGAFRFKDLKCKEALLTALSY